MKVMSKMGISTAAELLAARRSSRPIGLHKDLIARYFTRTASKHLRRIGLDAIAARRGALRHASRLPRGVALDSASPSIAGGQYQYRRRGRIPPVQPRDHRTSSSTRCRTGNYTALQASTARSSITRHDRKLCTLRGLFCASRRATPIPLVGGRSPTVEIDRAAVQVGGHVATARSASEAHENLGHRHEPASAARANTGEGGEDPDSRSAGPTTRTATPAPQRHQTSRLGAIRRHQRTISSAAKEIQIKMAQGAKPGEGGQLPGQQGLSDWIAKDPLFDARRRPHLAAPAPRHLQRSRIFPQLIHDLKNSNDRRPASA